MEKFDNKKTVYLIDTYNLVFRAFFSFAQKPLITSYKMNVSAIYGFMNMLLKILNDYEPVYIACVQDTGEKTFREEIYEHYKANRPECPPDLVPQFDVISQFIDSLSIKRLYKSGLEADDIIGMAAKQANEKGYFVKIISSDRDLFQLISDKTRVICLKKGISEIIEYDRETLKADLGVLPEQIVPYKALVGDPSDNIPGVRGIGPKAAEELLAKYKDLDAIYENLPAIGGRRQQLLETGRESAYLSLDLARIRLEGDLAIDIDRLADFEPSVDKLHDLCVQYEQKKMFDRYNLHFEKRSEFFYGDTR